MKSGTQSGTSTPPNATGSCSSNTPGSGGKSESTPLESDSVDRAQQIDDPLDFPDGPEPDLSEPEDRPKPVKSGAEKPNPIPLVDDAIKQYVSPLIRALKNIAKTNGDAEGPTWAKAHAAMGTVIECLKEMKKGVK